MDEMGLAKPTKLNYKIYVLIVLIDDDLDNGFQRKSSIYFKLSN
jgi:hypothetical protein